MEIKKIIRWIVCLGAFLLPLWFLPFTSDVLEFNKQVLLFVMAGVGLVLFLVDMIKHGILRYRPTGLYWSLAFLVLAGIVSAVVSVNRYTSIFGTGASRSFSLVSIFSLAIFFFLALNTSTEDRGKRLRVVLTGSLALTFLVSVLQAFGLALFSGSFGKATFNTIGSLNTIGFLAAASLPLFLIPWHSGTPWKKTVFDIIRYLGIASALLLLVIINWGPLWIVTFVTVLATMWFTSFGELRTSKMQFYALPMAIVALGLVLWITHFNFANVKSKFPVEVSLTQSTSYSLSLASLKAHPLGYGLENYAIAYDKLRSPASVNNIFFQARFTDSSSEFATMIAEGGIVMVLAFLAFLVYYLWLLVRQIRRGFGGYADSGKLWASSFGLLLVFFVYPVSLSILFVLIAVLALAITVSETESFERIVDLESKSIYSLLGSVAFIIGLACVLVGGYFVASQYIANVKFARAQTLKNTDQETTMLVDSINTYSHDSRVYRMLSQVILTQIADDLKKGPQGRSTTDYNTALQNRISSAVSVAERSTIVDPADSENWVNRGYVYQNLISLVNRADQLAIDTYKEALARSPANALVYLRVGNIYLTLADNARKGTSRDTIDQYLDQAEQNYKKAIALYGNYGQALYNLAATYDRKGELQQAIKQFEKLQQTNQRDPSILFQLGLLYYRNGQKDPAFKAWQQAVQAFPNYSNARWYLSLIYEERNQLQQALDEVKAIEKFNPDNQLVLDRIAKLTAGIRTIPPSTVLEQKPLQ